MCKLAGTEKQQRNLSCGCQTCSLSRLLSSEGAKISVSGTEVSINGLPLKATTALLCSSLCRRRRAGTCSEGKHAAVPGSQS